MDEITRRPRGRPRKHPSETDGAPVQALERGLNLLKLLASDRECSLTELAMRAGMPPSTAHRLLTTLQTHRFAEYDERTQNWMIGVEAYRIGSGFLDRINLVEAARPFLQALVGQTGETANLAIPDDGEVVFIRQIESLNPVRAFFRPGSRSPMHASGAGKALMAHLTRAEVETLLQGHGLPGFTANTIAKPGDFFAELDRIRSRGVAFDDQERYEGMSCVAAPIFDASRKPLAAISVSGPSARFTERNVADFGAAVRRAATELTRALGGGA